ncbi:MAG: hypothetical protein ABWY25_09525 [Paenisporosarcina sp.]
MPEEDGPESESSEDDITEEEADDEETASLRPLFPDGNPETADAWKSLFHVPNQPGPGEPGDSSDAT